MHDPAAAIAATNGESPDALFPADDFTACTLTLHRPANALPDYTMSIGIDKVDETTINEGQPLNVDGMTFYRRQLPGSGDGHETTPCVVYLQQPEGYTLYLQVSPPIDALDGAVPVCDLAASYLKATARRWRTPPVQADRRTDPSLNLAAVDPCAVPGIVEALGNGRVLFPDLHKCLFSSPRSPADSTGADTSQKVVDVQFQFDDPNSITNHDDPSFKPLAVAGVPAAQHDYHSSTQGCVTSFRVGTASVTVNENTSEPPRVQIAEITATTCALSTRAAEAVVNATR